MVDLAIPVFGYQNHISIDRGFGFIRKWSATDAAAYEGRQLREGLLDKTNTASGIWAIPHTGRRPTRRSLRRTASSAMSTAKSQKAAPCRGDPARQQRQIENPLQGRACL